MGFSVINKVVFPIGRITPTGVILLGTSFLLEKSGNFATAAHVVKSDDNNLVIITGISTTLDYQDTSNKQIQYIPAKISAIDPFRDICILVTETVANSNLKISGTDSVQTGEVVVTFGFPHADHGRMVLTQQRTEIGAKILIESNGIKSKHVILNIQARPGQSGSPIFRISDLSLIGILIGSYAPSGGGGISLGGIDPATLHQTTHVISAEYLKEML